MAIVNEQAPVVKLSDFILEKYQVELYLQLLHLSHPTISGNKWFKLKYNLQEAKRLKLNTILTFGGAFSNHIHATAVACKELGFRSIGIIRGERSSELNPTLTFAENCGMRLHYVDRSEYKNKHTEIFVEQLKELFGEFYLIPEGGSNELGVKGCTEIMENVKRTRDEGLVMRGKEQRLEEVKSEEFDYVCCACGTGATLAGITLSLKPHQKAIGFSSLKGRAFLDEVVNKFIGEYNKSCYSSIENTKLKGEYIINTDYHFGGYAKITPQLLAFVYDFEKKHSIPLDYVYTSKMLFGLHDLVKKNYFNKGAKLLALHTGGLQGNAGFKEPQ